MACCSPRQQLKTIAQILAFWFFSCPFNNQTKLVNHTKSRMLHEHSNANYCQCSCPLIKIRNKISRNKKGQRGCQQTVSLLFHQIRYSYTVHSVIFSITQFINRDKKDEQNQATSPRCQLKKQQKTSMDACHQPRRSTKFTWP